MEPEFRAALRAARRKAHLSMAKVAARSGLSYMTVRGYEGGRRNPSRKSLLKVLATLGLTAADQNALLALAGFASVPALYPSREFPDYFYGVDELQRAVEKRPWPAFATNDAMHVVAANRAAQALWRINYASEKRRRTGDEMSLFAIGRDAHFSERMTNFLDVVRVMASVNKGRPHRTMVPSMAPGLMAAAIQETASDDPELFKRLQRIWEKTKPAAARVQWDLPVVWRDPDCGTLRFIGVVSCANDPDVLNFHDWHPIDGNTWRVLEKVMTRAKRVRTAKPSTH
jgi:transcriptional regulator with XRE-family HTH domain